MGSPSNRNCRACVFSGEAGMGTVVCTERWQYVPLNSSETCNEYIEAEGEKDAKSQRTEASDKDRKAGVG